MKRNSKLKNMSKTEAVLRARINALEWVLMLDGRWTNDSEVGLIQLSSVPQDRAIATEIMRCVEKLEQIESKKSIDKV